MIPYISINFILLRECNIAAKAYEVGDFNVIMIKAYALILIYGQRDKNKNNSII